MTGPATLRERLRALETFPRPGLPELDPGAAPTTPHELFGIWLDEAIDAGVLAPHAVVLSTADVAGNVHARTVILKDVTDEGWWFASQSSGPKGRDLEANPHAAMTFLWPGLGRQVRVSGTASPADPGTSRADFLARPDLSRAAGLVNRQSEPLGSLAEYDAAFAAALDAVTADPRLVAPEWTAFALAPTEVEFWQASDDGPHVRLLYREDGAGWTTGLLWP
ncbi:pyridoxal 5'-phosphate synthase [Myceligenerans pegani]|uniref:Pyridoxal 5'-phosphate synthase n=1 Tax=Myceligenerans pegani TaxID=2776917 RepID=A0ABR9N238_9MICO|nr:pyridoxal 5'-phosphate synthase [Myceligenerans sp. TRM 65318]MBE1877713.1 pyridoxal 5'-phosphate synthase [Myceligenerans sp. TRM 65318]MBE3019984.1 pyridoxal 5'-phosphate synthase [Myceligenerans sp. TRM 65318]